MGKIAKKKGVREKGERTLLLGIAEVIRGDLREFVVGAGMSALAALLERERTEACGPRYLHQEGRAARRAGHARGELVMGGRLVTVRRPRARTPDGRREVVLPSWSRFAADDPLRERAMEQMLVGVSTRSYDRSLEPLPEPLPTRGTSKSAVSRRFVAATEAQMRDWLGCDLGALDLAVLMIDGVHVADHVLLVALGIDAAGRKHVLGVREGATENATACRELLADLRDRGMRTDRALLVAIDGSKALAKAVRDVFGRRALIQRCQVHKTRNVVEQLPDAMRPSVRAAMRQAYRTGDAERAKKLLLNLARRLRSEHPGAAASLDEGLDETLTVMGFGLPLSLERTLSTTNSIENLIGSLRRVSRRVKRWRDGQMILRWTVTSMREASKTFRRLRGHEGMRKLVAVLRAHDGPNVSVALKSRAA
jgi:transposase-like protein